MIKQDKAAESETITLHNLWTKTKISSCFYCLIPFIKTFTICLAALASLVSLKLCSRTTEPEKLNFLCKLSDIMQKLHRLGIQKGIKGIFIGK
jgi:hypothetical protein